MCERVLPSGKRCFHPAVHLHHKEIKGMGGRHGEAQIKSDSAENLIAVCLQCHQELHGARVPEGRHL